MLGLAAALPLYALAKESEPRQEEQTVDSEKYIEILQAFQKELEQAKWDSLSVPEKIRSLAIKHGVDESIALNIGCAESEFNSRAKNPNSTAGGVFQWLDSSWANYSKMYYGYVADKYDADTNIELSIFVLRDYGTRDWNASKHYWETQPFERGKCAS